ncbi:trypsin-like peptidase domain-containing protein [Pectobacterium brasiliense]|uniref:trypsin-like peptidase domain-containing protein n=1 Tax=Pectobacterium brasiliense TaxID=180957 RepID=UPI00193C93AD|nr:trypsin-like peptidase domain-containing protein [Pectobacterium brasiliense]QRN32609.1 trypsin-like peptidase domain-containing protein [Pectobacterium brasiliense]
MKKLVILIATLLGGCTASNDSSLSQKELNNTLIIKISSDTTVNKASASWLSRDLIITSSHTFLGMPSTSTIQVGNEGKWLDATVVVAEHPNKRDIAILKIKDQDKKHYLTGTYPKICSKALPSREPVLVASAFYNSVTKTTISPAPETMSNGVTYYDHLAHYFHPGSSGSPIYQASSGCLAGILSQANKLTINDNVRETTKFVTSENIANFIKDNKIRL